MVGGKKKPKEEIAGEMAQKIRKRQAIYHGCFTQVTAGNHFGSTFATYEKRRILIEYGAFIMS